MLVAATTALITAGVPALAGGASASSGSKPGVVASTSFVQGNGVLLSSTKSNSVGAGFKTLFTLPGLARIGVECPVDGSFRIRVDQVQATGGLGAFQNFGSGSSFIGFALDPTSARTISNDKRADEITLHIHEGTGSAKRAATVFIWFDAAIDPCLFTGQALVQT